MKAKSLIRLSVVAVIPLLITPAFADDNKNGTSSSIPHPDASQVLQKLAPNITQSSEVPAGFPLPIYPRAIVAASFQKTMVGDRPAYSANIRIKDPAETTYAWYRGVLSQGGWTLENTPQIAGHLQLRGTKADMRVNIGCMKAPKSPAKKDPAAQTDDLSIVTIGATPIAKTEAAKK